MTEEPESQNQRPTDEPRDDGREGNCKPPEDPKCEDPNGKKPSGDSDEPGHSEECEGKSLEEKLEELEEAIAKAKGELERATSETGEYQRQKTEVEGLQGELEKLLESYEKAREELLEEIAKLNSFKEKTEECFKSRKEVLECKVKEAEEAVDGRIKELCDSADKAKEELAEAKTKHEACSKKVEEREKKLERLKTLETRIRNLIASLKGQRQEINDAEQGCKSALAYYWFKRFCEELEDRPKVITKDCLKELIEEAACELWEERENCIAVESDFKEAEEAAEAAERACEEARDNRIKEIQKRLGNGEAEEAA